MANNKVLGVNNAIATDAAKLSSALTAHDLSNAGFALNSAEHNINKALFLLQQERSLSAQLQKDVISIGDRSAERRAINVGLRAVIRHALAELRRVDPNNPILDKKNRDKLFKQFEEEEIKKIEEYRRQTGYKPDHLTLTVPDEHEST
jgi:hypothetical protein